MIIPKSIKYSILPSTQSMVLEVLVVTLLFILLNIYIVYLAAYDSGFKPNFVMLLNFIFDDPMSLSDFKTYVKNIAVDEISTVKSKESFSPKLDISNENFFSKIVLYVKKTIVKLFVKGHKISTIKSI